MKSKNKLIPIILAFNLLSTPASLPQIQENPETTLKANLALEKGIGLYKHENYDEALPALKKAREEEPQSTLAAYYLGLTYKKLQRYKEAVPSLKDAVTFSPKVAGALIELIDCYYQLNQLNEAKTWIAEAEKESIRPAQTAFLKGLVLLKNGETTEAIAAFENAQALDTSMAQSCDYQIGVANLKAGKLADAKEAFRDVVMADPSSNIANFANQYVNALTKREQEMRPWKFSFGTAWQYDDNVILKPNDTAIATGISDKADTRMVYTASGEYNHRFSDLLGLKNQYLFYYGKQNDLGFYNTISHTLITQPSLYYKNSLLTFPTGYSYMFVNDRSYLSAPYTSGIYNFMMGNVNMGQVYLKYQNKNFLWTPSSEDENRDSNDLGAGLGWYLFYAKNKGFFNLRYGINKEWTEGVNWEYLGNRVTTTLLIPVIEKLNLTFSGDFFYQDFDNLHTIYKTYRKDKVYSASTMLAYKIYKDSEIQLQYTFVKDDSNINVYSYNRNIYSVGLEFKF